MTTRSLHCAVIGCGFFAVNQLHAWQAIDGVEVVAICDRDPERLAVVGDRFGISRRYGAADDLFRDGGFDFVDIATTVASHRVLVELAARHGVPVICQKPFASTLADARAMVDACAMAHVPLMVHENFRWQSAIRAVRHAINTAGIGRVFWGRVSFRSAFDVFGGQLYLAQGERFIIEDLGIHSLDVARYLFGDVTRLTARMQRVNPAIRGEDVATMLLDHHSGSVSVVDCSYATRLSREPFPEPSSKSMGRKARSVSPSLSPHRDNPGRHDRNRRGAPAPALGRAALAQYPGKRVGHPAALGRHAAGWRGARNLRSRQPENLGLGGSRLCLEADLASSISQDGGRL